MLTLLCAPSSAGKSTFYKSGAIQDFLHLEELPPIVFASEFPARTSAPDPSIIHYNLMRPFDLAPERTASPPKKTNWSYADDPAWVSIRALSAQKQAIVIVASKADLLARTLARPESEPGLRTHSGRYDSSKWHALYQYTDLQMIYSEFIRECQSLNIPMRFVASRDGAFQPIDEAAMEQILQTPAPHYTEAQIRELIKGPNFRYQAVPLPFGITTPGRDRSQSIESVLPRDLTGQSVLDVGSALGGVAFEAEKRGAARVVGLEPRTSRFEGSLTLKDILNSNVEFRCENLTDFARQGASDRPERFDYVLLLNVIHHLDNPIEALEICASLSSKVLAIEFPTLDDPKFAGVPPELAAQLNELPLMGVSTREADQTFVFTPAALRRLVMDHKHLFQSVEFKPSPMENRMIAIFAK